MATIQQNNIDFTNVKSDPIFMVTGKFSKSDNNDGSGNFDTTLSGNQIAKSFNAVEIDWNGAYFEGADGSTAPTYIHTTGDLITAIKYASKSVPINTGIHGTDQLTAQSNNNTEILTGIEVTNGRLTSAHTCTLSDLKTALNISGSSPSSNISADNINWNIQDFGAVNSNTAPSQITTTEQLIKAIKYASNSISINDGTHGSNSLNNDNTQILTGIEVTNGRLTDVYTNTLGDLKSAMNVSNGSGSSNQLTLSEVNDSGASNSNVINLSFNKIYKLSVGTNDNSIYFKTPSNPNIVMCDDQATYESITDKDEHTIYIIK